MLPLPQIFHFNGIFENLYKGKQKAGVLEFQWEEVNAEWLALVGCLLQPTEPILLRIFTFDPHPEGLAIFLSNSYVHGRACVHKREILVQPKSPTDRFVLIASLARPAQPPREDTGGRFFQICYDHSRPILA